MTVYYQEPLATLYQGDALEVLKQLPSESVDMCVTSPPYYGLRKYGIDGQIGLEKTPEEYVAKLVAIFREVRRTLKPQGVLFLNLGDSYAGSGKGAALKPKDLIGIPWRVAFALQADGWWLRQDIIWSKKNCMPESVTDRCTKSHEYIFLLSKAAHYYYDAEAIKEPSTTFEDRPDGIVRDRIYDYDSKQKILRPQTHNITGDMSERGITRTKGLNLKTQDEKTNAKRNKRSVWEITTKPYKEAHFATYPPALVEPCILAGTSLKGVCPDCGKAWERITENKSMIIDRSSRTHELGRTRSSGTMVSPAEVKTLGWQPTCKCGKEPTPATVLDVFVGSGTTMAVAKKLGRKSIGIELNPDYCKLCVERLQEIPIPMELNV